MSAELPPYRRPDLPVDQRVADLLSRMTLEEKIDQLHQCGVGDANPNNLIQRADELRATYGSFMTAGDLALRNALQRRAVEQTRLGIPAIFGADVIHGYRTIFPIPLAQACAWDADLLRHACRSAAESARADGLDWTFAPMVDHGVDPRWGRIAETFGESPYAGSVFAAAAVTGYQEGPQGIAACLKHYVGYGASEGGRDYSSTEIAPQRLWEMHLPPFEAGVRAGALTVMSAFNDLNGVPASANHYTLTEVLRQRWGFQGFVVSDWGAVQQLIQQGYAADEADAAQLALLAGVDLDMADGLYRQHLAGLIAAGRVPLAAVDEAVSRILRVKFERGLFEQPFVAPSALTGAAPTPAQLDLAEEFAARAMVLLKNTGVLPLGPEVRRLALIGPLATDQAALLGSWAQQGRAAEVASIEAGLRERLPAGVSLRGAPGCPIEGGGREGFDAAVALARESDAVVLCLGESAGMSGENASRSTLRLPGLQEELALVVAAAGKPVVLLVVSGRPVELAAVEPKMAAILAVWQPGTRGGAAVADLLLGRRNPSGRLSVTWPRTSGQIPIYHNMRPRARTGKEGAYQDIDTSPLYEFGHGLSYTTFAYGPIRLARPTVKPGETLTAEVTVTNTGKRDGIETVLWFIRDPAASITRPLKDLKHFESASIAAGASRGFRFEIDPARDLSFPDADGHRIIEPGEIILFAGPETARFNVGP
ncbi:MAG: glycoside hydrolase family 3 N-terminal domain-containing protein [Opitutaceae bacterium]|nr:glycoside hydrolase family 3 N-terminal domain-containing protein [Opitutaceae bacterium]